MKHKVSLNIAVSQLEEVLIAKNMLSEQHYIDSFTNITLCKPLCIFSIKLLWILCIHSSNGFRLLGL